MRSYHLEGPFNGRIQAVRFEGAARAHKYGVRGARPRPHPQPCTPPMDPPAPPPPPRFQKLRDFLDFFRVRLPARIKTLYGRYKRRQYLKRRESMVKAKADPSPGGDVEAGIAPPPVEAGIAPPPAAA